MACRGPTKHHPHPHRPKAHVASAPVGPAPSLAGARLYRKYCALCHGDHGQGYRADNAPSLVNPTFLSSASDSFLRSAITRGRVGTAMAGYGRVIGGPMTDDEIREVIAFLRAGGPVPASLPAPGVGQAGAGRDLYTDKCRECHGEPGHRAAYVYLAHPSFLSSATDRFLRQAIVAGRPGTRMEAWSNRLDEQDVADVIAFMHTWPRATGPDPRSVELPEVPLVLNPRGRAPRFTLREERFLGIADLKRAVDTRRRLIIADARPSSDWLRGHIPGAVSLPYYDLARIDALHDDGTWVVAYCACPHHASGALVDELRRRGFAHTAVLDEGILGWQRAGYPAVDAQGHAAAAPPALRPAAVVPHFGSRRPPASGR
jgi:rhodanese-related sulfurtransferase/mono/diheme cytochrome c family protein